MGPQERRQKLIVEAAALVSAMYALLMARVRLFQTSRPEITDAPMSAMDEERQRNNLVSVLFMVVCLLELVFYCNML
jgi:hypothetical protein